MNTTPRSLVAISNLGIRTHHNTRVIKIQLTHRHHWGSVKSFEAIFRQMKQTVPTNSTAKNSWAQNVGSIRNQSSQNKIKSVANLVSALIRALPNRAVRNTVSDNKIALQIII